MNIIIIPKHAVRIFESWINGVRITEGLLYPKSHKELFCYGGKRGEERGGEGRRGEERGGEGRGWEERGEEGSYRNSNKKITLSRQIQAYTSLQTSR